MPGAWLRPLLVLAGSALAGALVGWLSGAVVRRLGRGRDDSVLTVVHRLCHRPWSATLTTLAVLAGLPSARLPRDVLDPLRHAVVIVAVAVIAWLLVNALFVAEEIAFRRLRVDVRDNLRARRMRTQLDLLRRITASVISVVAVAAILLTFDAMRAFGASLLASAGLAGVIAGLAAQTTLGNVFAGLQLAFSDALRLDDVVVVEEEWGRIEELTLTYVVVHLWDERRLVLPTSFFTTTPFQNWTRSQSRILGSVMLYVDPAAPIELLRAEARRAIEANPLWDQRDWVLQVVDTTERALVVRVLASAADAASAWDLRCDVREHLTTWLRENHPEGIVRERTELVGTEPRASSAVSPRDRRRTA